MARRPEGGFSLVELMVAAGVSALLMAGMFQIFAQSQRSFNRTNESLGAQRSMRWSLDMIGDDFQQMGYFFPPPNMTFTSVVASSDPTQQSCLMIVPRTGIQKIKNGALAARDLADDPFEPLNKVADEISYVSDVPLPVSGSLDANIKLLTPFVKDAASQTSDPTASNTIQVNLTQAANFQVGDIVMVNDPNLFECARITAAASVPANTRTPLSVTNLNQNAALASFTFAHQAGTNVTFVRPLRIIRYALVYLGLGDATDPDAPGGLVPCLVRFEAPYATTPPNWATLLTTLNPAQGSVQVIAEHVTSFQVDFSLDTSWPGVRSTSYAATLANIDAAIQRIYGRAGETTNISDPLWIRKYPGLFRITLETRSPVARSEVKGQPRRYLYRNQTLMFYPRNFGVDRSN